MLRESAGKDGGGADLSLVMGAGEADGGVPHGRVLVAFSEAVVAGDGAALDAARAAVIVAMGSDALVDAAAVAALFDAIDRVADATGIPLEDQKLGEMADFMAEHDIARSHA